MSDLTRPRFIELIDRWKETGYGIDPNQIVFRHYRDNNNCECMTCRPGLHPIIETGPNFSLEHHLKNAEQWRSLTYRCQ